MEFVANELREIALNGYVRTSYKNRNVPEALLNVISDFIAKNTFTTTIKQESLNRFSSKYEDAIYFDVNDIKFDVQLRTDIAGEYLEFVLSLNEWKKDIKKLFIKYEMICKQTNSIYKSVKLLSTDHIYDKATWPHYILPIKKCNKAFLLEFICKVQLLRIVYSNSLQQTDINQYRIEPPQNAFCKIKKQQTFKWTIGIDNNMINGDNEYFNLYFSDCYKLNNNGWDILFVYDAMKRRDYPISLELQLITLPHRVKAMYVRVNVHCNQYDQSNVIKQYISYRNNFINLWEMQKISNVCLSFTITVEILNARDYYYNLIPVDQWDKHHIV